MDIDSCYQVGYVIKRHGFKGDVKIHLDSALPKKLESIFVMQNNRLVPFFIEAISVLDDVAIVKFEDVNTPEQATALLKSGVYLPNSQRPKSRSKGMADPEIIGFEVFEGKAKLGHILSINEHALNPLLVIDAEGKELLIPISEYFIKKIDLVKRRVDVTLPDGFLNI